jgi:protein phosphatase 1 regulatory subunit 42
MQGVACTLKILDMAECQIESLDFMIPLINLEYLDVSKNCIETVEDTISALENLSSLQKLYVAGNPFCRQLKYRDSIVVSCAGPLLEIDDKIISNAEKEFLKVVVPKRKLKKRSSLNIEVKSEMMDHDVDRELIN